MQETSFHDISLTEKLPVAANTDSTYVVVDDNTSDKIELQCPRSFVLSFHVCIIEASLDIC